MNPDDRDAEARAFGAAVRKIREGRGESQAEFAKLLGYTASYVSKIETGDLPPTEPLVDRAEEVLHADGALVKLWRPYSEGRGARRRIQGGEQRAAMAGTLVVEHEVARLEFVDGTYRTKVTRHLRNEGQQPITRYLIRVAVDRQPGASHESNRFYRKRPLTLDELGLTALCDGEPMSWRVDHDRDAFKEIWLLFENERGRFPLYPGITKSIEYEYSVTADKWGKWWQRAIRLPTERLSIELVLPANLHPMVWGIETSLSADRVPVRPAIASTVEGDRVTYSWSTAAPSLHSRYRFEWRFDNEHVAQDPHMAPSEHMKRLGIVQRGELSLTEPSIAFDLPSEADAASALADRLLSYLPELHRVHNFGKGIGLAAPQIGINRSAAVVALPGQDPLVLFNPSIVSSSDDTDLQYEGCLSFFDVRGLVERPLHVEVQHSTLDGQVRLITFEMAAARHWCHEIDHLEGVLYSERLASGSALVPIEKYGEVGHTWAYQADG